VLVPVLGVLLALVAGLADRALVGRADALGEAAVLRIDEDARLAVLSVEAALGQVEHSVSAGRAVPGVAHERLALPPPRAVPPLGRPPVGERSRGELAELLSSDGVTPNGLPEAVVARLALGPEAAISSAVAPRSVGERLLAGELPVRPEDLPYLADRLGRGGDPRVRFLADRLQQAPVEATLPVAPAFQRRLSGGGRVEGWSRVEKRALVHYALPSAVLLERAGVSDRATVSASDERPPASGEPSSRRVAVPGVPGMELTVRPRLPGPLELAVPRGVLWSSALAGVVGLVALRRALTREARAVARERTFLTAVTHELRSPLASIRLLGETLAEGRGEPRDYGTLVAQESHRLEGLVERVLTLTRVEQALRPSPVHPGELLREAVALARPRAERRHARLECQVEDSLPECRWDTEAVRRALLNLIDNALSHGQEGVRIQATASVEGSDIRLFVADDGPGIAGPERSRIFRRFWRGRTEAPGTGLGLFLVEEVARAHGGRVDLVTAEGRGSTFTLVLPREATLREEGAAP
jgi:two-component system sensor histidine kinase SenX3